MINLHKNRGSWTPQDLFYTILEDLQAEAIEKIEALRIEHGIPEEMCHEVHARIKSAMLEEIEW
jgi:hypothetical protein